MESEISIRAFLKLLHERDRGFTYTNHAKERLQERNMSQETFERDLRENPPYAVVEQSTDEKKERKFKIYFRAWDKDGFSVYIIHMNHNVRLRTVWRTSKKAQNKIYIVRRV